MTWSFGSIIGLIIAGIVFGFLGRMVAPGRQPIPLWLTIFAGIVGALIGNLVATWFGVAYTGGVDWLRHLFQLIAAAIAVVIAAAISPRARRRSS